MRIAILLLVLPAALPLLATAQGQEPTGSISGRIVFEGQPPAVFPRILVIPADAPQPFPFDPSAEKFVSTDEQGYFAIFGLADGDYFLITSFLYDFVTPSPETVDVLAGSVVFSSPALRVTIANGQAVTGIEIVIRRRTPLLRPPDALSPSSGLPETGAGDNRSENTVWNVGLAVTALAGLALAGGAGLWLWEARGRRP